MSKYLIDTSIWVDLYEDRKGLQGEPHGEHAFHLLTRILTLKHTVVVTDFLIRELETRYSLPEINGMFAWFPVTPIASTQEQLDAAELVSAQRNLPRGDCLYAVIARDHKLILVTRDRHFLQLWDFARAFRPEEICL